jgi:hypothetical protein
MTKLLDVMFSLELADRLEGTAVTATCLNPGFNVTGLGRELRFAAPLSRRLVPSAVRPVATRLLLQVPCSRHIALAQYSLATNSSCAGNLVRMTGPLSVTTTSSSIRAAEKPSEAGA